MQKHIYVKQEGIEEISREDLNSLASLTDLNLDETSNLIGKVHTTNLFIKTKEVLEQKFPQFKIDYDTLTIIDSSRLDSPILQNNDKALMEIISRKNWSTNTFFMTIEEAAAIKGRLSGVFTAAANIIDFSAFKYFTGITEIYGNVFQDCEKLETIILPPNAKINSGGDSITFRNCVNLKNVTLNKVTTDYDCVFVGCTSLKRIEFPEGTISISNFHTINRPGCFKGCTSLQSIKIPSTLKYLGNISQDSGNSYLSPVFSETNLITIEGWDTSNIEIIGTACFCNNNSQTLKLNRLPSSVKQIGRRAFENQQNIAFTELPEGITHIGDKAFYNTKCNFTKLPESITTIFYNGKLQSGGFPWANTTGTQMHPLYNSILLSWGGYYTSSDSLTNTVINNTIINTDSIGNIRLKNLQKIGQSAFEGNINLKTIEGCGSIIGSYAFKGCSSLTNVKGTAGSIGTSTYVFQNSGLKEITSDIWNLFGEILPENTFNGCSKITSINFPDKFTGTLNSNAITGTRVYRLNTNNFTTLNGNDNNLKDNNRITILECPKITSTIAWSRSLLPTMCEFAFFPELISISNNSRLTSSDINKVIIGDKIESFGNNVFDSGSFQYIVIERKDKAPSFTGTTIKGSGKIYIPIGMKSSYLEYSGWNKFADRIEEVTDTQIEQLKDITPYYGVKFFTDKYYDTKIHTLPNIRFDLEYMSGNGQGYIVGGGYQNTFEIKSDGRLIHGTDAGTTYGSVLNNWKKHRLQYDGINFIQDGISTPTTITVTYPANRTIFLGSRTTNYPQPVNYMQMGIIYKFLLYENDTLVQAWIGNENGGFDIYADEDIEPQENDTINPLEMYAIRYQQ